MELLGVAEEVVRRAGAVSADVAQQMAESVRDCFHADVGVAITGLTGGGGQGKPAGLTFVAATLGGGRAEVCQFTKDHGPGRNEERAARMSIALVLDGGRRSGKYRVDGGRPHVS